MKLNKDDYYSLVSDLITHKEFEKKIAKYYEQYSGLLIKDVIAHLIVDELGRNVTTTAKLSELHPGFRSSIFVTVSPPAPRIFTKTKYHRPGAEIFLTDSKDRGRLILWDSQHVKLVEDNQLKVGTKLKLVNAKVSKSDFGLDITLDRFESLIIEPPDFPDQSELYLGVEIIDIASITDDGPVNIMGTIAWKSQLRTFNKKDKSLGSVLNLELYDGTGKIRITLWDDFAKTAEEYDIGEQIKLINGYSKMHKSVREVHSNYRTQIFKVVEN